MFFKHPFLIKRQDVTWDISDMIFTRNLLFGQLFSIKMRVNCSPSRCQPHQRLVCLQPHPASQIRTNEPFALLLTQNMFSAFLISQSAPHPSLEGSTTIHLIRESICYRAVTFCWKCYAGELCKLVFTDTPDIIIFFAPYFRLSAQYFSPGASVN